MRQFSLIVLSAAWLGTAGFARDAAAQTPEQQQMWDAQRAAQTAADKVTTESLMRQREARRADPMAWVRTLDPMTAGGWQFRAVAADGSWADFGTDHQMKRSGRIATVWLRQEYAEVQIDSSNRYMSVVQKVQYDCVKHLQRPLLAVYYPINNLQGTEQTEEADPKTAAWNAIVPGTRNEANFAWACADKAMPH